MYHTLADLNLNDRAVIIGITPCNQTVWQRLLDFGFVKGAIVWVQNISPLGDPVAYCIHGCQIALRREDAVSVLVEKEVNEKL